MRTVKSIALANIMVSISHLITHEFFNIIIFKKRILNLSYKYFSSCYLLQDFFSSYFPSVLPVVVLIDSSGTQTLQTHGQYETSSITGDRQNQIWGDLFVECYTTLKQLLTVSKQLLNVCQLLQLKREHKSCDKWWYFSFKYFHKLERERVDKSLM